MVKSKLSVQFVSACAGSAEDFRQKLLNTPSTLLKN